MKERLDQLTLQQLIDLSCGDGTVLLDDGETADEAAMVARAAVIMNEYKSIADPVRAKMDMTEAERETKLRMKERCARLCLVLCSQGRADMAREVLLMLDVPGTLLDGDEQVRVRSRAIVDECRYELERLGEKGGGAKAASDPRRAWMSEVAFVMATLKMGLDTRTTNAAIYANLVRQAVERVKAMAKAPPMARMFM